MKRETLVGLTTEDFPENGFCCNCVLLFHPGLSWRKTPIFPSFQSLFPGILNIGNRCFLPPPPPSENQTVPSPTLELSPPATATPNPPTPRTKERRRRFIFFPPPTLADLGPRTDAAESEESTSLIPPPRELEASSSSPRTYTVSWGGQEGHSSVRGQDCILSRHLA